jgi:hypothetical protein
MSGKPGIAQRRRGAEAQRVHHVRGLERDHDDDVGHDDRGSHAPSQSDQATPAWRSTAESSPMPTTDPCGLGMTTVT